MKLFQEKLDSHHAQVLTVDSVVHQARTAFQDVLIFENRLFGRVLVLDDVIQLTERDNHIYHEMIAHVPLMAHGKAKRVLIIGGGDGGTLREVLKHPVDEVVLVEIDAGVVDLAKEFFPQVSAGAFEDKRAKIVIGDGVEYVARAAESSFDVVIIDSTDPEGPGEQLFTQDFYDDCWRVLRRRGILVLQSGIGFYQPRRLQAVCGRVASSFEAVSPFLVPVPTYAAGMLALVAAGEHGGALRPPVETLTERWNPLRSELRYYTPDVHWSAFTMPPLFLPRLDE